MEEAEPPDDKETLAGLRDAVSPEGATEDDNETVPEKLLRLARLIMAVPDEPDWNVRLDDVLEMLKSAVLTTLTATVVGCDSDPLVPVTVTVYVPVVDDETVRVDDAEPPEERLTLVGLRDAESPDGETEAANDTVPVKLLRLDRLMTDVPDVPA